MYDPTESSRLANLCVTLKGLRDEAIRARADSGIEQIWTEDREYYDGIDDANRSEKLLKPTTSDGRVVKARSSKKATRSSIFLNITKRYVNAAAAHVSDKLFRSDVSNYGLRPTPIPSLVESVHDTSPAFDQSGQPVMAPMMDEQGEPVMQMQTFGGQPMMDQATGQPVVLPAQKQLTAGDVAKQQIEKAKKSSEKAKSQIDDWLIECGINGESRRVVLDGAMIGTGILKGPFPEMVKSHAVMQHGDSMILAIEEKLAPKSRRISAWNLYPDPSCGDDIHRGRYVFEEDEINSRLLAELKDDPSYMGEAIDRVIEEGPKHALTGNSKRAKTWEKGKNEIFQIWYYHGYLTKEELESCGYEFEPEEEEEEPGLIAAGTEEEAQDDELSEVEDAEAVEGEYMPAEECECKPKKQDRYPCICVMVNDVIIKATMSPFDSGRFPYHVFRWEYRDDHWAGTGVARQMRTSQDGVNAGVRMLHDNAGVSGAPILIIDRNKIEPADGNWTVGPHKVYYSIDGEDVGNIRDAFTWIIAPSMQAEMMNIITFWMRMAEEETGMPMLLQGQQGNIEHTLGEAQMLNNNGSAMLRRVTNIYDDDVTKSHIGAYYEWLMIHGEDNEAKGDFQIDALGSSVLIERDANSMLLMQMLGLSLNPAYGADPELVFKEFLLSQRFDAEKLVLSDEKKQEMASRQPPEDPRITAAKIMAQARGQEKQGDWQAKQAMQQSEQEFEAMQADLDRALEQWAKTIEAKLDQMRMGGDRDMNTDNLKVELTNNAAKIRAQLQASMMNRRAQQIAGPAMEPAGRAMPGNAFQQ